LRVANCTSRVANCTLRVQFVRVDSFTALVFGGIAIIVVSMYLLGRYYPGSGLEQVGLRSAREIIEKRGELEAEDLDQMLDAHNARLRARGERELSAEDMELRVSAERHAQQRRRDAYLADRELDQLLDATNQRRRERGLPARTPEQAREEFGGRPTSDD
jgi:hypothetical protein